MIWLTWRQFRVSALAVFGALGAVAAVLAFTGPELMREYQEQLSACGPRGCHPETLDNFFFSHFLAYFGLNLLVLAVPVIVGMFWGVPLVTREFETATQDLVWQQSITRGRWLAVKLGVTGLAAIAAAGLTVAVVTWWSRPLDAINFLGSRMSPFQFDVRGIAIMGHAAFGLSAGVAIGLLIRRTVPAMAVTFAVIVAAMIAMPVMVRPHLATPERLETAIMLNKTDGVDPSEPVIRVQLDQPGAWVLSNQTVDSAGRVVDRLPYWVSACAAPDEPSGEPAQQQCFARLTAEGYRQVLTYHPAGRFWPFQVYETAIFAVLSLLLAAFSFWRIRPH